MTALTGSHTARETRFRLACEAAYGLLPDTPEWHFLPLAPGDRGLSGVLDVERTPQTPTATAKSSHAGAAHVAGRIACPGLPASAEQILDLALARGPGGEPISWTADVYSPDDPTRLTGLVVDELEWTVHTRGSELAVAVLGRSEQPKADLSPADFGDPPSDLAPYTLRGAQVTAGGSALAGVREVALHVRNAVRPGPAEVSTSGALRPAWMSAGRRTVTVRLRYLAAGGVFRALQRSGQSFALVAALPNAMGRLLTVQLPAVYCRSVRPVKDTGGPAERRAELLAVADTNGTDISWTATP
jgi:hypothetical protein